MGVSSAHEIPALAKLFRRQLEASGQFGLYS
jgi:hypothetical protein